MLAFRPVIMAYNMLTWRNAKIEIRSSERTNNLSPLFPHKPDSTSRLAPTGRTCRVTGPPTEKVEPRCVCNLPTKYGRFTVEVVEVSPLQLSISKGEMRGWRAAPRAHAF